LLDGEGLQKIVSACRYDGIVHFAAKSLVNESVGNPTLYYRNNVCGSLNLLEAAQNSGILGLGNDNKISG